MIDADPFLTVLTRVVSIMTDYGCTGVPVCPITYELALCIYDDFTL